MGVRAALKGLRPRGDDRDILAVALEIENEQTFHLKLLYKYIHEYVCKDMGYSSYWGDDNPEILFFERTKPDGAQEHHIWWRFYKYPNNSSYLRYFLKIDFQTLVMSKNEIIQNGQKFKMNKGDIILRIQGFLQLDYNDEWRKHWLLKNFDQWFRKRLYRAEIEYHKEYIYKKVYELQNKIKQFLQLARHEKIESPFWPVKGIVD